MRLRASSTVAACLMAGAVASAQGGAETQDAAQLAAALQKKYDTVRDFAAEFVQTYRGGVLRKQLSERGTVRIKKPGRMRWEYNAPDEKLVVSDGVKIYFYVPKDKQATVTSMPDQATATTPALFLAGRGNIARDFTASLTDLPDGASPAWRALKLTPRAPQPDFEWLTVIVDPATLSLRGLSFVDAQGGTSTFVFTNLKENVGLTDKAFEFRIPRGVDVVTDTARR
jgi:outer membrane lipoprotein carrier protein